ncbi:MAG: xanthine dehydrogenase family protein subunit M [Actinomycetes bacterium]
MREVFLPRSLDEVWDLLDRHPGAAPYAGGTDLLVAIAEGKRSPAALVCLERVGELGGVEERGDRVWLGAAATYSRLLGSPLVQQELPLLCRAMRTVGSPPVRHMGTLGGNVVTASPAGDTLPPLHVLGAEVELASRFSRRLLPIADFVVGPGATRLAPGELLLGVAVPKPPASAVGHHEKVGRRKALACAVASLAAILDLAEDGIVRSARLAWGSVGPTVVRVPEVEAALAGRRLERGLLASLAPAVERAVAPIDDVRASAAYRRVVSGLLLERLSLLGPAA